MNYLTEEDILEIHSIIVDETGGTHGVRDRGVVSSASAGARQKVFNKELHDSIFQKAASYARAIILNHPFVDGNKRTGITCAFVFLEDNGFRATAEKGRVEEFALKIVEEKLEVGQIANWLEDNSTEL